MYISEIQILCAISKQLKMPIVRCSDQKHQSLEEFYLERLQEKKSSDMGKAMLSLIDSLNSAFKQTTIFGLTSHYHLILLSQDSFKTDWYVSVVALDDKHYFIEYLIPEKIQPWPHAKVKGEARSLDDAMKYISIGMSESLGWPNNQELRSLYLRYN